MLKTYIVRTVRCQSLFLFKSLFVVPRWRVVNLFLFILFTSSVCCLAQPIDRQALVKRHTIVNTKVDTLASLSLGNGKFAFTADITGLQTFPEVYAKGVPLGTQSEWGWDSFKDTAGYAFEETLRKYNFNGKESEYTVQWREPARKKNASDWFRKNAHRLQLGNLGFDIYKADGTLIKVDDVKNIRQVLDLWTGELTSQFTIENVPVVVVTYAHQDEDVISVQVKSKLIRMGRLKVHLRFPFPTAEFVDEGINYENPERHTSSIVDQTKKGAVVKHQLEGTSYFTIFSWNNNSIIKKAPTPHYFQITPSGDNDVFELSCKFSSQRSTEALPDFIATKTHSQAAWKNFWMRGGAIDFTGSTDPRATELERRIILSQYLTKIQCTGSYPPQETGLTYNSWFGKPHLEMHWWHGVHFALWNRLDLLEKSLDWYADPQVKEKAKQIAERQGFKGVRWQKMVDHEGNEAPSSVGSFLIWQQPHLIYFAELCYRDKNNKETLEKYKDLVFATAEFMASFPHYNKEKGRYDLGKGLIPAQECFPAAETFNPTYEVAYWDWALKTAQKWRERLGLQRNEQWDEVIAKLAPLPVKDSVYLSTESAQDSYTNKRWLIDHPAVLGALGMVPESEKLNKATMQRTFDKVWKIWTWDHTWGWDFPMTAMNAARLGNPEKAIDALFMDVQTNTYLKNGHNYQDERLRIYLPGNGGVLIATAMMAGGWDGSKGENPGFPKNGKWKVRSEGFKKMP